MIFQCKFLVKAPWHAQAHDIDCDLLPPNPSFISTTTPAHDYFRQPLSPSHSHRLARAEGLLRTILGHPWGNSDRKTGSIRDQAARTCNPERRTQCHHQSGRQAAEGTAQDHQASLGAREMDGELAVGSRISSGSGTEESCKSRSTEMSSLSEKGTASGPHSRRVDPERSSGPQSIQDSSSSTPPSSNISHQPSSSSSSEPSTTSPPIPPRSPLRPVAQPARGPLASTQPADADDADQMPLHARSYGTISGLLDQPLSASLARRPTTPDKPLPLTPQPSDSMPLPLSSVDPEEDDDDETLLPKSMSTSSRSSAPTIVSKRDHALSELLASERSYASDLAVIGDVHVPLALGQPAPCSVVPATPPGSSGSSTRTLSTASDSSAASYLSAGGPPMTREDSKIIFNNVSELAVFADELSADLEKALGDVLEGGTGEDWVGKLFLQKITKLETLYRPYITKHSTAIEHLNNLPQTPALTAYLAQTRTLASTLTHAWDLPSLLIKPVQRLLKYPLLLTTIIEETPDSHPDKANLIAARDALEEFARGVNEGRRRREVVREVLGAPGAVTPQKGEMKVKKKGLNVGVAASVNLGRMKSLRNAVLKAKEGPAGSDEAEAVKKMGERLRQCEESMHKFAKEAVRWADSVRELMLALDEWAQSFGSVIWMGSNDERSEAFDAFLELISEQLLPVCDETKDQIVDRLLPHIQSISDSATAPSRLLEAMHTLEPLHYGLLNINVSKSRPPLQLLEASQSYLALRAQLFADLPAYLRLFDKGLATCIYRFALIQQRFYSNVRDRWGDLWDALKVDEEANQGAAETLRVWWSRFAEVEIQIQGLNIIHPPEKTKHSPEKNKHRNPQTQSVVVSSVLAALDPLNIPHPTPAGPSSFQTSPEPASAKKTRSLHSMESESHLMSERKSQESLHSKKSGKSGKSRRPSSSRVTSMAGSTLVDEPPYGHTYAAVAVAPLAALAPASSKPTYSRTKSMPISSAPLNKSHSTGKYLDVDDTIPNNSSNPSLHSVAATLQEDSRGRPSRKPSFRRRLTDSFRTTNNASVDPRHRRSPSLPTYSTNPSPSPNHKSTFSTSISTGNATSGNRRRRPSGGVIPALYQCRVIHPCEPPPGVSYRDIGFFTLVVDDVYDILQEAGHPSIHRDLPLYVDDGEDCLLLARSEAGEVGWVLASFLLPVD